jgi:hypothetical protein
MKTLLAFAALALFAAAPAQAATPKTPQSCFYSSQWTNWRAADRHTIYLRVRQRDIYEVKFRSACPEVTAPGAKLITVFRTGGLICKPIDLDIKVSTTPGFKSTCIASSLRKLSPAEAKALPKKFQP